MTRFFPAFLGLAVVGAWLCIAPSAQAATRYFWRVASPGHGQTFAYGSESSRIWAERGHDKHLAVLLDFTNEPYVDEDNPKRCDDFTFSFPGVTLGKDGRTFYYRTSDGRSIPVASKRPDFFGVDKIKLLPNANLIVDQPHGYLSLSLVIRNYPATADSR